MIKWLIKIGTPRWDGGKRIEDIQWAAWGRLAHALLNLAFGIVCIVSMLGALSNDDYAKATFWLLLMFVVTR